MKPLKSQNFSSGFSDNVLPEILTADDDKKLIAIKKSLIANPRMS
jgi:hypothetical protein